MLVWLMNTDYPHQSRSLHGINCCDEPFCKMNENSCWDCVLTLFDLVFSITNKLYSWVRLRWPARPALHPPRHGRGGVVSCLCGRPSGPGKFSRANSIGPGMCVSIQDFFSFALAVRDGAEMRVSLPHRDSLSVRHFYIARCRPN